MLFLLGIRKNVDISIREGLNIDNSHKELILKKLLKEFDEAVILSTCNRCEIYFRYDGNEDNILDRVISLLNWNKESSKYLFIKSNEDCVRHLFEVTCGLHSRIKGESQILGQVKEAYRFSLNFSGANSILGRMFECAINCGKTFRSKSKLYEIPVSIVSIATNKLLEHNCSSVMVIGYGKIGKLAVKYLLHNGFKEIIIAVRNVSKVNNIDDNRVKIIDINNKNDYIDKVHGIISCTSSQHVIVKKEDVKAEGDKLICLDLALPRDFDTEISKINRVTVYNVDEISKIDDNNKKIRDIKMRTFRYVIDDCVKEYLDWIKIRDIAPFIKDITDNVQRINSRRIETYHNKGSKEGLVETLIESTSNVYLNRAIELLKEETLKGSEEECLRIIKRIFNVEKTK